MTNDEYDLVSKNYSSTADVPKDLNIFYRCLDCGTIIPSVPEDNIGCACGNVFIDKDSWRLIVADLKKFEVLKGKQA